MTKRLEMLEKLIEKGSQDPFVYYARAMELRGAAQGERALAAFEEIGERFANYVPTYLMAAQVALELSEREAARVWAQRGLEVAKAEGDDHAESELGTFLDQLGQS